MLFNLYPKRFSVNVNFQFSLSTCVDFSLIFLTEHFSEFCNQNLLLHEDLTRNESVDRDY